MFITDKIRAILWNQMVIIRALRQIVPETRKDVHTEMRIAMRETRELLGLPPPTPPRRKRDGKPAQSRMTTKGG